MRPSITSRPRSATSASTAVFLTRQSASPTASMSSGMAFRPARLRSTAASLRSSASPLWSFLREKSILSIPRLRQSRAFFMAQDCGYVEEDNEPAAHLPHAGYKIRVYPPGCFRCRLNMFFGNGDHFLHAVHDKPEQLAAGAPGGADGVSCYHHPHFFRFIFYFGQLETLSHVNDRDDGPPQVNDAFYKLGHAGERRDLERPEDLGYGADVKTVFFQTHLKRNDLDRVLDDRNLFLFTHF